jgi:hypothetical protein
MASARSKVFARWANGRHASVSLIDGRRHAPALAGVQNVIQLDGLEMARNAALPLGGRYPLRMPTQRELRLRVVSGS